MVGEIEILPVASLEAGWIRQARPLIACLFLTCYVCQGSPILPGEHVAVHTNVLGNLLICFHNSGEFGMYRGTLDNEWRVSRLCHFPGGCHPCSRVGRSVPTYPGFSSSIPPRTPSLHQGAKATHWTTGEERQGCTVPSAGCPMDVVSL